MIYLNLLASILIGTLITLTIVDPDCEPVGVADDHIDERKSK